MAITYLSPNEVSPKTGEVNSLPSRTFPDMSVSLRELVERYRMGTLPVDFVRSVLYDESDDFDSVLADNLAEYDLVDKQRELDKLRQKFEAMRSRGRSDAPDSKSEPGMDVVDEPDDKTEPAE